MKVLPKGTKVRCKKYNTLDSIGVRYIRTLSRKYWRDSQILTIEKLDISRDNTNIYRVREYPRWYYDQRWFEEVPKKVYNLPAWF